MRTVSLPTSDVTVAAFKDVGASQIGSHVTWLISMSGRNVPLPPKGFVGLVSSSFQGIGALRSKLVSIQVRRLPSTRAVPLWRLTCEWELLPPL